MEFFRIRKDIPFMRYALIFNVISIITFLLAVFFIAYRGLHFSVEFTGGTVVEVRYEHPADLEKVRGALQNAGYADYAVQHFGSSYDVLIRLPLKAVPEPEAVAQEAAVIGSAASQPSSSRLSADNYNMKMGDAVVDVLQADDPTVTKQRVEFVGPMVGGELAENGALALLLVVIGIVIYLAFRFEWRFSVSAIIANLHDVIIIIGFFAFFQWEFSLSVLAAVLAVLGYSVNESVVVFDRVRETFRKTRGYSTPQVLDHAITATISRTIITHGSTQMMVLSMLIFGGEVLHYFAMALTIGICFGIYSSVLVASPLVMWLGVSREQFVKQKREIEGADASGAVV